MWYWSPLLAAAIMSGYTWKAMSGIGSRRKYNFRTPATTLISSQELVLKSVFSPSVFKRRYILNQIVHDVSNFYLYRKQASALLLHHVNRRLDIFLRRIGLCFQFRVRTFLLRMVAWFHVPCSELLNPRQIPLVKVSGQDSSQQVSFPSICDEQLGRSLSNDT